MNTVETTSVSPHSSKPIVGSSLGLEVERIKSFGKAANKHGNNGGNFQSGRKGTYWHLIFLIENTTKEIAIEHFEGWLDNKGYRIVQWHPGYEEIMSSGSRY